MAYDDLEEEYRAPADGDESFLEIDERLDAIEDEPAELTTSMLDNLSDIEPGPSDDEPLDPEYEHALLAADVAYQLELERRLGE